MAICRYLLVAFLCLPLSGCTLGWYELKGETYDGANASWECPQTFDIAVNSGIATRAPGFSKVDLERRSELTIICREVVNSVLQERGCSVSEGKPDTSNNVLKIEVDELQQIYALPQEYLTGLSFGLIPSWGPRPAELSFKFTQNERSATYVVDEMRFNHLLMFPFVWLTFVLESESREFRKALEQFVDGP